MPDSPNEKIKFSCPQCNTTFQVAADKGGRKAKCSKCEATIQIPARAVDEDPLAELMAAGAPPSTAPHDTPSSVAREARPRRSAAKARKSPGGPSKKGLIAAGILALIGVALLAIGPQGPKESVDAYPYPAVGVLLGSLILALRSLMPTLTGVRGALAFFGGLSVASTIMVLSQLKGGEGTPKPGAIAGVVAIPVILFFFAFRIKETKQQRKKRETHEVVRKLKKKGTSAQVCTACGGAGTYKRMLLDWPCKTCDRRGYMTDPQPTPQPQ